MCFIIYKVFVSFIHFTILSSLIFYFKQCNDDAYLIFYPGFPNGGECWADIHANGHYNHCKDLPKGGAIILKATTKTVIDKIIQKQSPSFIIREKKRIQFSIFLWVLVLSDFL